MIGPGLVKEISLVLLISDPILSREICIHIWLDIEIIHIRHTRFENRYSRLSSLKNRDVYEWKKIRN